MRRLFALALVVAPSCQVIQSREAESHLTAVILTDVLGMGPGDPYGTPVRFVPRRTTSGDVVREQRSVDESKLLGDYYWGDGLGFNLVLLLRPDHRFQAQHSGCVGIYGKSSGTWSLGPEGLELTTLEEDADLGGAGIPTRLRLVDTPGIMFGLVDARSGTAYERFLEIGLECSCAFYPTAPWPRERS